ncbi:hypothetical protein AB0I22_16950 [Streptomyces sp. NPDC050610]|uniref:hypothetical protein n=1 Tax=Streptomyces sp. NPDC050610 TaxID=3157097 RepID=UPI00343D2948
MNRQGGGRTPSTMAEATRGVQGAAGNAAMVQMLRSGEERRGGATGPSARTRPNADRRGSGRESAADSAARPVQRAPQGDRAQTFGQGGPLDGLDHAGNYYRFDFQHVKAKALRDVANVLVGISFPTQPGDVEQVTSWAKKPQRTSDVEVYSINIQGTIQAPIFNPGPPTQAPWSNRPLYVHAHASNEFFKIPVEVAPGTVKAVKVDGATFSRILRNHPGYREAARNTPGRDGLLMSCTAGHPMATAAADMAHDMHSAGSKRTWYAPSGMGVRFDPLTGRPDASGYGSGQSWDAQGNETPGGFVAYPPPRRGN